MSLSSPIDFSMRAEDKGFDYFGTPLEDHFNDSFFDQYVNSDSLESSDDCKEIIDFNFDIDRLFDAGNSSSSTDSVALPDARPNKPSSPEPWRKGLWCLNEPTAQPSRSPVLQTQTNLGKVVSPGSVEALSLTTTGLGLSGIDSELRYIPTTLPPTPPTIPSRKVTKNLVTTPKTIGRPSNANERCRLFRRSNVSPTLMHHFSRRGVTDDWEQRLHNIHLQVADEKLPHSPPPSLRKMQHGTSGRVMGPQRGIQHNLPNNNQDHQHHLNYPTQLHHQQQAISSPTMASLRNQTAYMAQAMTTSASLNSPVTSEPPMSLPQTHLSHVQSIQPWHSAPLDSGEFSYGASPDVQSPHAQTWWSPASPTSPSQPCAPASTTSGYHHLVQPTPQRPVHNLVHVEESSSYVDENSSDALMQWDAGLMINYASPTDMSYPSSAALPPIVTDTSDYPPLPSATDEQPPQFSEISPFTPRRRRQHNSPSHSPSISPSNTSRVNKRVSPSSTSSTRACHQSHSSRSSGRQSGSNGRRAKSANTTPKTPTGGFSNVDFVNYTPHDSKKILTGVAPSGSSKTKARREMEAKEKRRKLSEAAIRAVKAGDVDALEAVLC